MAPVTDECTLPEQGAFDLDNLTPVTRAAVVRELRSRKALKRWLDGQVVDWDVPASTHEWLRGLPSASLLQAARRSITGPDNRIPAQDAPAGVPQHMRTCVAAVMRTAAMSEHDDATVSWPTWRFIPVLCGDVKFADEPFVDSVHGTAFAVRPDRMVTAGHVLNDDNFTESCFVFGPWTHDPLTRRIHVPADAVRYPKRIVAHSFKNDWSVPDYCIIELCRPMPAGTFFPSLDREPVSPDTHLYTLGYPHGLELKYADTARITGISSPLWIGTTLDVLRGCSGSPVFDARSDKVIGIVALTGEYDLTPYGDCYHLTTCDPCNESCTRITLLLDQLA